MPKYAIAARVFVAVTCWVVAAVLFLAVFGKATKPLPTIKAIAWAAGQKPAGLLFVVLLAGELILGSILAARLRPQIALFFATAMFTTFACWNVLTWMLGAHAQCGCGIPNPLVGLLTPSQASLIVNLAAMSLCLLAGLVAHKEARRDYSGGFA